MFDCECRHLAKGSIRNYRAETKFLMEFLELNQITEVEDVKAHHIRDFMKQKQDSGNTACYVNDILKACKTWFNYLVEEDYIEERRNPAAKVKYLKQPKTIIETFSTQEVKELIHYYSGCDYLEVRNKTIITLLFDTGMRCNEMIMMEPEDIKKDYIVVKHGKGNKERVVPKSPMLSKQLVRYLYVRENYFEGKSNKKNLFLSKTGKPLTDEAVARMLKKAALEVGVSPEVRVSPHTCRHTFAQINLTDKDIKHIIIETTDIVEFMQCLGRKRSQDENDTINLYFLDDIGRISGFCTKYKKDVEIAKEYELLKDAGQLDEFKKKYLKIRLPCFFDNEPKIIYPAYYKILSDCEFYESIVSKGTSFHKEVENRLGRKAVWYERKKKNEELSSYLSKNIGRRYEKDEREELVRIIDYRKDGHCQRKIEKLNHYLTRNQIGFILKSIFENRKTYWIIECAKNERTSY